MDVMTKWRFAVGSLKVDSLKSFNYLSKRLFCLFVYQMGKFLGVEMLE